VDRERNGAIRTQPATDDNCAETGTLPRSIGKRLAVLTLGEAGGRHGYPATAPQHLHTQGSLGFFFLRRLSLPISSYVIDLRCVR
jgi:hypothetical protein